MYRTYLSTAFVRILSHSTCNGHFRPHYSRKLAVSSALNIISTKNLAGDQSLDENDIKRSNVTKCSSIVPSAQIICLYIRSELMYLELSRPHKYRTWCPAYELRPHKISDLRSQMANSVSTIIGHPAKKFPNPSA